MNPSGALPTGVRRAETLHSRAGFAMFFVPVLYCGSLISSWVGGCRKREKTQQNMTSLAQSGERAKRFVLCFRYFLHSSMMSRGVDGGREGYGTGIFWRCSGSGYPGKLLQGSSAIYKFIGFSRLKNHGVLLVISNFSSVQGFGNIDPACIQFTPNKVLCVPIVGDRSSSPRLAVNSPESPLGFQPGSWGTRVLVPCQKVPGSGGSQHQPGLCLAPQPLCSLTARVLRGMH